MGSLKIKQERRKELGFFCFPPLDLIYSSVVLPCTHLESGDTDPLVVVSKALFRRRRLANRPSTTLDGFSLGIVS